MTQPQRIALPSRRPQRGISIIMAIFLLLLFGLVAALIASLTSTAHITQAQDIEGARAYQAARAGVEWGIYKLDPNSGIDPPPYFPDCFSPNPTTLNQIPGHSVVVNCTRYPLAGSTYNEGTKTIRLFLITARATATGVQPPGVERQVEATIEKCRDSTISTPPYDC